MKILKQQNTENTFPGKYIFRDVVRSNESSYETVKEAMRTKIMGELSELKDEINLSQVRQDFKAKKGKKERIIKRDNGETQTLRREGGTVIKMKENKIKIKDAWFKRPSLKVKDINRNGEFDHEDLIKIRDDRLRAEKLESKKPTQIVDFSQNKRNGNKKKELKLKNETQVESHKKPIEVAPKEPSEAEKLGNEIGLIKEGYTSGDENFDEYLQKIEGYRSQVSALNATPEEKVTLNEKLDELKQFFENEKVLLEERKQREEIQSKIVLIKQQWETLSTKTLAKENITQDRTETEKLKTKIETLMQDPLMSNDQKLELETTVSGLEMRLDEIDKLEYEVKKEQLLHITNEIENTNQKETLESLVPQGETILTEIQEKLDPTIKD
jgi:hypothetical protein